MKTHSRSVDSIRSGASRFTRENRELNDASVRDYDLEREVWDLTVADRIQQALAVLTPNEKDAFSCVLRRPHLPRGGGTAR